MQTYRAQHVDMAEKLKEAQETTDFTNSKSKGQVKALRK